MPENNIIRPDYIATPYHVGFIGGLVCENWGWRDSLTYVPEKQLTSLPLRIDCLVLKKKKSILIDTDICRHFLGHNIVEYKSWRVPLNIQIISQALVYAFQYLRLGSDKTPVRPYDLTITIFRHVFPRKFFKEMAKYGWHYIQIYPGVYQITGVSCIPLYIVAAENLPPHKYEALKILLPGAREEDIRAFMTRIRENRHPVFQNYAAMVIYCCSNVNRELVKRITEEERLMAMDIFDLREKEIREQDRAEMARKLAEEKIRAEKLLAKEREMAAKKLALEKDSAERNLADGIRNMTMALGLSSGEIMQAMGLSSEKISRISSLL